jgi:hypothetical protein
LGRPASSSTSSFVTGRGAHAWSVAGAPSPTSSGIDREGPGDTLVFGGKVTKNKENGDNRIDAELSAVNQKGEIIVTGSATAALPSRG